jgi:hypothetical protein
MAKAAMSKTGQASCRSARRAGGDEAREWRHRGDAGPHRNPGGAQAHALSLLFLRDPKLPAVASIWFSKATLQSARTR